MNEEQMTAEVIRDLAYAAATPDILAPGNVYLVRDASGQTHKYDLTGDEYRATPRRIHRSATFEDVLSFVTYYQRYAPTGQPEIFADISSRTVTAILDSHGPDSNGWCAHKATLALGLTDVWSAWSRWDGTLMDQVQFAEHLDKWRKCVISPPAAEMVELAQTFHATQRVSFSQGTVLQSGQKVLQYAEDLKASAGAKGQLTIPESFHLALVIFEGEQTADAVEARLRYRLDNGTLKIGYMLDEPATKLRAAFRAVVDRVQEQTGQPVLWGNVRG